MIIMKRWEKNQENFWSYVSYSSDPVSVLRMPGYGYDCQYFP